MKRVLLCGNSLFVSGLQASLGIDTGLEIQQIEPQEACIHERVKLWKPDVLIVEKALLREKVSLSILNDFPQVRIISVDIDENRLLVLTGLASEKPSTEELLQMIAA
ncbi:MAG: hypothetical protein IH585_16025 [Anaerolineaceae bacterium]|nr:hypothetical protein [Anaerolineaceae bacterium]